MVSRDFQTEEAAVKRFLLPILLFLSTTTFAQQTVPEIPFDSVPNFLKLPPDLHLGEASGVAVNSRDTFLCSTAATRRDRRMAPTAAQLLEFGPDGKFIREIGKNLYAWSYRAHGSRRQRRQHLGRRQRLGHDHQVQSGRPRRRWCSAARRKRPTKPSRGSTRESAAPARGRPVPPADRCHLGHRRATSSSATATSIRASPSSTRTATG